MDRCIRYAITELGEFFDAELRATASGELRNNDKAHDPRSEGSGRLHDCVSAHSVNEYRADAGNLYCYPYMVLMLVCDYAFSSEAGDGTPPIIWLMRCTFGRNTALSNLATLRLSCRRRAQRLNSSGWGVL